MNDLTLPIIFMLVMVIAEALVIQRGRKQSVDWHDLAFNLNSGHIMLWLFRGLEIFCYGFVVSHFSLGLVDSWPVLLVWVFTLLAWDFGFYWLHRLHHTFAAMWAVHIVHHQGEHFNLSLGVRNSWYSSLTSIPFFMLLALMGVPLSVFITVSIVHYSIQFFNHSALIPKLGWWEKFMVTPTHHRVHHVKQGFYSNRNFGGSFIFWDKWFGTFHPSLPDQPFEYGVNGSKSSNNPLLASNIPFLKYLRAYRARPPSPAAYRISSLGMTSGTLILFALVIGYVFVYGYGYAGTTYQQVVLFLLLASGTIALSGISDGTTWGICLWLLLALILPAVFLFYWRWQAPYWLVLMSMMVVHALAVTFGWGRQPLAQRAIADE